MSDKKIIWVLDDRKDMRELVKDILEPKGYTCRLYEDGESLIRDYEKNEKKPDLIIPDIDMPGMNGLRLEKRVRDLGYTGRLLFMSGNPEYKNSIPPGAYFLEKPFKIKEMLDLVEKSMSDYP